LELESTAIKRRKIEVSGSDLAHSVEDRPFVSCLHYV
jgi:hypothetical protein